MGNLTITTTAPQDARIIDAFGKLMGLGRNATAAEVKARIIQFIRDTVQDQERATAAAAVTPSPMEPV